MIDKADKKTRDLLGKKRGRPATGQAMTAAERKRQQRARAKKLLTTPGDLKSLPTSSLVELVAKMVAEGMPENLKQVQRELLARAKSKA